MAYRYVILDAAGVKAPTPRRCARCANAGTLERARWYVRRALESGAPRGRYVIYDRQTGEVVE
jgi:hypothetical protein